MTLSDFNIFARLRAEDSGAGAVVQSFDEQLQGLERTSVATGRELSGLADHTEESTKAAEAAGEGAAKYAINLALVAEVASKVKEALVAGVETLISWANSAGQAETIALRLEQSFRSYGTAAKAVTADLLDFAEQQSRATGSSRDSIAAGIASIATFEKNTDRVKAATQASLNFAAAKGIDEATAFNLLAKAAAGNTTALSRYGVVIDDSIPKSQKFAEVLRQINENMGGAAEAAAAGYEGRVRKLVDAFTELRQELGKSVTENETIGKTQSAGAAIVNHLTDTIKENGGVLGTLRNGLDQLGGHFLNLITGSAKFVELLDHTTTSEHAAAEASRELAKAQADASTEFADFSASVKQSDDILKGLGITAQGVAADAADKLRENLETLRKSAEAGTTEWKDYFAAVDATKLKLAELPGTMENVSAAAAKMGDDLGKAKQAQQAAFDKEDEIAAGLDGTTDSLLAQADAAQKAADGWTTLTEARTAADGTDSQIAGRNLAAVNAAGAFVSILGGSVGGLESEQLAQRRVNDAKRSEGAGNTVPLSGSQFKPFGSLGAGSRIATGANR